MLATYKSSDDKNHLEFWASSILNQNDKEELSVTAEDIMPIVKEIENTLTKSPLSNLRKLSTVDEQWWVPMLTGQKVKENINEFFLNKHNIPYTISFSQEKDKLLMWTMYANNGQGLCLVFDETKLVNYNVYKFAFSDIVSYNLNPAYYKDLIKQFYDKYIEELGNEYIINIIYQIKRRYWESMLIGISPFIKNEAFKDEAEYRIAYYVAGDNNPPVYTRLTSRLNSINYIKVLIPLDALQYIIIGPCANSKQVRNLLVDNMRTCGIDRDYNNEFIQESNIPYRQF